MVKLAKYKDEERILKAAKDKQALTYKDRHIRVVADLSTETWQARKEWQEIFNLLNRKNMQPRILYSARLSFRIEGEIKAFPDKHKLKKFMTIKRALQEILRGTLSGKQQRLQSTRDITTSMKPTDNTMTLNPDRSIISLKWIIAPIVNGLNAPIKRHRVPERIKKTPRSIYIHSTRDRF